jgi:hypothetical protein
MDRRVFSAWPQTIERLEEFFRKEGFQIVRSFDLQSAREGLRDPASCPCPHHGTDRCSCQYLVYQLYGEDPKPITFVVHGHDSETYFSLFEGDDSRDQELWNEVGRLFTPPQAIDDKCCN